MMKIILPLVLLSFGLILQSCNPPAAAATQNLNAEISSENSLNANTTPNNENLPQSAKVEFKGVSFNYNPQIFTGMTGEEVAELPLDSVTDKPDSVMPKHILFNLKSIFTPHEGTLRVIPIDDYRRMYAVSDEDVKEFDSQLKVVKKEVRSKSSVEKTGVSILPFWDAHEVFIAKARRISFQKGRGVLWLTQWSQDFADLVNNESLTLMYEGISDDNKYFILAEFSIAVPFLPDGRDVDEFEGFKLPTNVDELEKHKKEYNNYLAKITKRVENLPQNEFKPNLSVEKIISTLKVEK